MDEKRRFGFEAKTRYRFFSFICAPLLFALLIVSGDYRWLAIGTCFVFAACIGLVDPVGTAGKPTILGIPRQKVAKYVRSVFGRDLGE